MNRKDLKSMMLSYTNASDGNVVNMYVKSVNSDYPYIVIPSTATPDDTSARYQNTGTKNFSYNSSFIVKEKEVDTSKYEFSNDLYGVSIARDLGMLDDDVIITINANAFPLISEEVFENIQNSHRTLIIEYGSGQWYLVERTLLVQNQLM